MDVIYDGEYKITILDNGCKIREIDQADKILPVIKTPEEKAKSILAGVNISELETTDIGKAVKALLVSNGLIN